LLATALEAFEIAPSHHLEVMVEGQTPNGVAAKVLERLPPVLDAVGPAALLVQGDTTTVLASSLTAFHLGVPLGHVEAGLRTRDLQNPFPEEANRQLADRLARWCFAPTEGARSNLLAEDVPPGRVSVTGNTAVDALLWAADRAPESLVRDAVLLTLHRRESFGEPLREVLLGVKDFLESVPLARVVWPVHPNPRVLEAASTILGSCESLVRMAPLGYREFVAMLRDCRCVLTDSGGIQEEAPSLGKRVLIARDVTERPEAVSLGINRLVGRRAASVSAALKEAWNEPPYSGPLPAPNPYGDGRAAVRIVDALQETLTP
jgi:UDP-N-acetylglucosamine 2-epimerase (non-hydrolysing)